eukprot:5686872-Amphidinium_carterae.2
MLSLICWKGSYGNFCQFVTHRPRLRDFILDAQWKIKAELDAGSDFATIGKRASALEQDYHLRSGPGDQTEPGLSKHLYAFPPQPSCATFSHNFLLFGVASTLANV